MAYISTSGITSGSIIQSEHLLRIIDALSSTGSTTIGISGPLQLTGSFNISGSAVVQDNSGTPYLLRWTPATGLVSYFTGSVATSGTSGNSGNNGSSGTSGTSGVSGAGFPFTGSALITGSLGVTGSINQSVGVFSGSVISNIYDTYTNVPAVTNIVTLDSASYAAIATKDPNTLYVISGSAVAGLTSAFPYTGSAIISGSLIVTGSAYGNVVAITVASNTASIDMNAGNFFTVTLANSATTRFEITGLNPGETGNIFVTTGTVSSASFSTNIKQPSGSAYLPSSGSGITDVLSVVALSSTLGYLVNAKRFI
jgi:hypothetical protein